MHRNDEPQSSLSLFVGVMGLLVVLIIVLLVQGMFLRMENEELDRKGNAGLGEEADFLRHGQELQLTKYARGDDASGGVKLPIERAMELVVEEYGRK